VVFFSRIVFASGVMMLGVMMVRLLAEIETLVMEAVSRLWWVLTELELV
jgi:hypothetical protein